MKLSCVKNQESAKKRHPLFLHEGPAWCKTMCRNISVWFNIVSEMWPLAMALIGGWHRCLRHNNDLLNVYTYGLFSFFSDLTGLVILLFSLNINLSWRNYRMWKFTNKRANNRKKLSTVFTVGVSNAQFPFFFNYTHRHQGTRVFFSSFFKHFVILFKYFIDWNNMGGHLSLLFLSASFCLPIFYHRCLSLWEEWALVSQKINE